MHTKMWIENKMLKDGYVKTCQSYTEYCLDAMVDLPRYSSESYSRTCRKIRQRIEKSSQPKQPFDVTTPLDSTDFHKVDLNKYEITGLRVNTWGAENNQNKQVRLDLKGRKDGIDVAELVEQFKREVAEHSPALATTPWAPETGKLLEISIYDIHLGLLSWAEETGGDYDLKIAKECFIDYVTRIVAWGKANCCERILFPVGNDLFNSDTPDNTTTKGTRQDEDTRWHKTFRETWQIVRDAIEICLSVAPTDVIIIPGNHDETRTVFLGEVIKAWFRNNSALTIDNSPKKYKVYTFGKVFVGLTHGHLTKGEKLPIIFASDFPAEWSRTTMRVIRIGHIHQEKVQEYPGIRLEWVPSGGEKSAWSAGSGYRSLRGAFGYLWDSDGGDEYVYKCRPRKK